MYNRYIPNGSTYTRVIEQDAAPASRPKPDSPPRESVPHGGSRTASPLSALFSGMGMNQKNAGLAGIFKGFKLDDIDTGDILLLLILLFLFRDGEDMELVILLGLILLLGLGDREEPKEAQDS